jgi:rRNA maturation RNase YbeY
MNVGTELSSEKICGKNHSFFDAVLLETLVLALPEMTGEQGTVRSCISAVDREEIRRLNREYRGIDRVTDVLSFPNFASPREMATDPDGYVDVGDLVLCCDIIRDAAEKDGVSLERELVFMVSHGFLHLLGFEHGRRMYGIQDDVCDRLAPL